MSFTPHLLPLNRGLFTTASVPLTREASRLPISRRCTVSSTRGSPSSAWPTRAGAPPRAAWWARTICDVAVVADARTRRATCVSAIDNLGKGGAANGVQNLNAMMGWDERTGLDACPVYP